MNLISCENCGVVVDKDRLNFPNAFDSQGVTTEDAEWNGYDYVAVLPCPICGKNIQE